MDLLFLHYFSLMSIFLFLYYILFAEIIFKKNLVHKDFAGQAQFTTNINCRKDN